MSVIPGFRAVPGSRRQRQAEGGIAAGAMYLSSDSKSLTRDQARELDDTYFSSDPWGHFRSAIQMLLERYDATRGTASQDVENGDELPAHARFVGLIGHSVDPFSGISAGAQTSQAATDAYALRHHLAECLLRFTAACLTGTEEPNDSTWVRLTKLPIQIEGVLKLLQPLREPAIARTTFTELVIPPSVGDALCCDARLASAIDVFGEWLQHSALLLRGHQLDLSAAHNKVKHGFAVRARDDMRVTFSSTSPRPDGTLPLSAVSGEDAVDLIDRPVLEVLSEPKADGHRQGLEVTQLRIDPPTVLAEAYMIAWVHAALFHTAALKHYGDRNDLADHVNVPPFPGLPVLGPHPRHIGAKDLVGMRFSLTLPPGGGPRRRPTGIAFRDYFQDLTITGEPMLGILITED